jgi:hypothetical protein
MLRRRLRRITGHEISCGFAAGRIRCDQLRERIVKGKLMNRSTPGSFLGFCALALAMGTQVAAANAQGAAPSEPTAEAKKSPQRPKARQVASKAGQKGGPRYYIEFRSRYALSYGHTFTMRGRLNARGEIATKEVAGLHPQGAGPELWTVGHLVFVPAETGPSDGDLEDEYMSARYRVELSEAEYNRIDAHIREKQKNSPLWHAALYNCNKWTGEIAEFMGLKTPFHWLPPQEFINGIKDLNGGRQHASVPAAGPAAAPAATYSSSSDDRYPVN